MFEWFNEHRELFWWMTVISIVFFVASLIIVGVVIVRLPADYLKNEAKREAQNKRRGIALKIGRNIVGWLLILAGIAMLIGPGQGLLVCFIGVMLADFPGKQRVERWILTRGKVLKTINWLRRQFHKPPLETGAQGQHPKAQPSKA